MRLYAFLEPDGHPFINGCFNWMIPNLYIKNGCFTKHPFKTGCLGFQVPNLPKKTTRFFFRKELCDGGKAQASRGCLVFFGSFH